jgi:hypothetical protein
MTLKRAYLENGFIWKWLTEEDVHSSNTNKISKKRFLSFLEEKMFVKK